MACYLHRNHVNHTAHTLHKESTVASLSYSQAYREALRCLFVTYAWPGGYEVTYLSEEHGVLCSECAKRLFLEHQLDALTLDIRWEGPPIECDECGWMMASVYGEPVED